MSRIRALLFLIFLKLKTNVVVHFLKSDMNGPEPRSGRVVSVPALQHEAHAFVP